jgi:hypothetical protein
MPSAEKRGGMMTKVEAAAMLAPTKCWRRLAIRAKAIAVARRSAS